MEGRSVARVGAAAAAAAVVVVTVVTVAVAVAVAVVDRGGVDRGGLGKGMVVGGRTRTAPLTESLARPHDGAVQLDKAWLRSTLVAVHVAAPLLVAPPVVVPLLVVVPQEAATPSVNRANANFMLPLTMYSETVLRVCSTTGVSLHCSCTARHCTMASTVELGPERLMGTYLVDKCYTTAPAPSTDGTDGTPKDDRR